MLLDWLLKSEEGNIKDARTGHIKMESKKMETCHMAEHCRESASDS